MSMQVLHLNEDEIFAMQHNISRFLFKEYHVLPAYISSFWIASTYDHDNDTTVTTSAIHVYFISSIHLLAACISVKYVLLFAFSQPHKHFFCAVLFYSTLSSMSFPLICFQCNAYHARRTKNIEILLHSMCLLNVKGGPLFAERKLRPTCS